MLGTDQDIGEEKIVTEYTNEQKVTRFICMLVFYGFLFFVATIGACTAHSNMYDGERNRTEAEIIRAEAEKVVATEESERNKTDTIQALINRGVNPVAARCAVEGWNVQSERELCERVGLSVGGTFPKTFNQ